MSVFQGSAANQIRLELQGLPRDVRLVFFTQTFGCETCPDEHRILQSVAELAPRVSVEEVNLVLDRERAQSFGVTRAPSVAVVAIEQDGAEIDYGVRLVGLTAGHEITSLIDAIRLVADGESRLTPASKALLASVSDPVTIQVFVTPT